MPQGYPDFFGQQQFPKFGPYNEHIRLVTEIANTVKATVFNLEAKAFIYSLYLQISNLPALDPVDVLLTIDGDSLLSHTLETLFERNWCVQHGYPLIISRWDVVAKDLSFVGASGITISSSFKLELDNDTGGDIFIDGAIHYAKVI